MKNKYLVIFFDNNEIKFIKDVDISFISINNNGDVLYDSAIKSIALCDNFEQDNYEMCLFILTNTIIEYYLTENNKNIQVIKYLSEEQCFRLSKLNNIFNAK